MLEQLNVVFVLHVNGDAEETPLSIASGWFILMCVYVNKKLFSFLLNSQGRMLKPKTISPVSSDLTLGNTRQRTRRWPKKKKSVYNMICIVMSKDDRFPTKQINEEQNQSVRYKSDWRA